MPQSFEALDEEAFVKVDTYFGIELSKRTGGFARLFGSTSVYHGGHFKCNLRRSSITQICRAICWICISDLASLIP